MIEAIGWRRWALPFVWIGMNPITIYLVENLVDLPRVAQHMVGLRVVTDSPVPPDLPNYFGSYDLLVVGVVGLLLVFGLAGFLYQRKIFLRL